VSGDVEELAAALRLEKVVVATTGGGAPYALGVASYAPERVQGMLLISPLLSAGATKCTVKHPTPKNVLHCKSVTGWTVVQYGANCADLLSPACRDEFCLATQACGRIKQSCYCVP